MQWVRRSRGNWNWGSSLRIEAQDRSSGSKLGIETEDQRRTVAVIEKKRCIKRPAKSIRYGARESIWIQDACQDAWKVSRECGEEVEWTHCWRSTWLCSLQLLSNPERLNFALCTDKSRLSKTCDSHVNLLTNCEQNHEQGCKQDHEQDHDQNCKTSPVTSSKTAESLQTKTVSI